MNIFVFYSDGYYENGDVGFAEFATKNEAAAFIQRRMAAAEKPSLENYRVIEGREIKPLAVEFATRIDL